MGALMKSSSCENHRSCRIMQVMAFTQEHLSRAAFEREAERRLPSLLTDLLDGPVAQFESQAVFRGRRIDFVARDHLDRILVIEVESSSRPGRVRQAAAQLLSYVRTVEEELGEADGNVVPVLVVPFMSSMGAQVAERERLNWIDLAGNARIRARDLYVRIEGRPDVMPARGRPSSPFAPRSARVTRRLLLDPSRWWRQKDLAHATGLDDGRVSRIVRRLDDELLLERRGRELRPNDPELLLDAWAQDYRFDRHDILVGHVSGSGIELARAIGGRLAMLDVRHAFTGLPAAWVIDGFAAFRLTTLYVDGDPRDAAEQLHMRTSGRGANVQIVGPNDPGVFDGDQDRDGLRCVSAVQVYLDLLHLPERAQDAARHLRSHHLSRSGEDDG